MTFLAYQKTVRDLLLAEDDAAAVHLEALGPGHWRAYRRMARARFYQTLEHAFEGLIEAVGALRFHLLVDRFLAESPPRSPYLRDIPGELLRFFESSWSQLSVAHGLPPFALDLARYEWAELDSAYSAEDGSGVALPFEMDRVAVLSPTVRILSLEYPVHQMQGDGSNLTAAPVSLCLYRDAKTHEVETLELTAVAARILSLTAQKQAPFTEIVRNAAEGQGVEVDITFVEALSTLLADLIERGVLVGSIADPEKSR